jgi:UDP:flavonoid glycosyltransferase YjiC (YdhE family)
MRVLMTSWAGRSHYFSLVPLGWALRAAGHEVRVATQPGFTGEAARAGLTTVAVGHDVDVAALLRRNLGSALNSTTALPADWKNTLADKARRGLGHFLTLAEVMAEDTVAFARAWQPDLVVFEPTTFAGPLAATAVGVPSVRHLWSVDFMHQLGDIEALLLGDLLERWGHSSIGVLGDLTVDPCPADLQVALAGNRQPVRYVPYNGPAIAPAWLAPSSGVPRLCVTWGNSLADLGIAAGVGLADILAAAADLDVEVIAPVTAAQRAAIPAPPPNARLVDPVALHLLLPSCAAIVHHGGAGSLMTALTNGIPQLVVPHMPDLAVNARQLAGTGAGLCLPAAEATPAALRERLTALLGDERYRAAAVALRDDSHAQPTYPQVVEALEKLPASL